MQFTSQTGFLLVARFLLGLSSDEPPAGPISCASQNISKSPWPPFTDQVSNCEKYFKWQRKKSGIN